MVLTDLMMPVMDGVELIRQLQNTPETSNIPVVALTANTTDEAGEWAREAGAVAVLAKPVDLQQLVDRLRRLPYSVDQDHAEGPSVVRSTGLGTCAHPAMS